MIQTAIQPIPSTAVAATAPQEAVLSGNAIGIQKGKDVVLHLNKSQHPPVAFVNAYACVSQSNYVQYTVPNVPGFFAILLPSFISALMVIIGWYVVNKAQSNRERRKQIREYASDLRDTLEVLEALTIGYHTAPREEAKESEIISKLGRFEKACSTLPRFLQSQKYFKAVRPEKLKIDGQCLQILRQAMTLNHFGESHTGALDRQDVHIQALELATVEMQEALERVRIDSLD